MKKFAIFNFINRIVGDSLPKFELSLCKFQFLVKENYKTWMRQTFSWSAEMKMGKTERLTDFQG